jgi:RND family efflux transporter MFP subunit
MVATLGAVTLALVLAGCGGDSEARNQAPQEITPRPSVATVPAEASRLADELDVTGTLMADAQTEIASEAAGRVLEVFVERGTPVRAGAVLARLDSEDARSSLREAEATEAQTHARLGLTPGDTFDATRTPEVQRARASMERAMAEHERYARLVDQGFVARSEYDLKKADWLTAKAQYDASLNEARQLYQTLLAQRARAAIARRALADTEIRAPWDGTVAEKHVTAGQYVSRGARVATLVRIDPLRVELTIPESAVAAVRKGQKVSFSVQSRPDVRFDGTIAYVGPSLRAEARTLVVEALVPNRDGRLSPGLFASARIELPAVRPAVLVPASAVRTEAGVSKIWLVNNERAEMRLIQVGRRLGDRVEVLRGVTAGDRVVREYDDRLTDGAAVAITAGS